MDLDRGVLARMDRKLLAGLGQDETFRMVRVPAAPAKWSTWKRYCDSAGISMGRTIGALIKRELVAVFSESAGDSPLPASKAEEELASREAANERCPCGSGLKYKHRHGLPGRHSGTPSKESFASADCRVEDG